MPDITIALVSHGSEGDAAHHWLAGLVGVRLSVSRAVEEVKLERAERIWIHGVRVEPSLDLVAWLRAGGRLLTTLESVELPFRLGLEPTPPDEFREGTWRDATDEFRPDAEAATVDYRHARGMMPFGLHPLFAGLGTGAFTWAPSDGEAYRWLAYRARRPGAGQGVAVEWAGRFVHQARWVAWEYDVGEGGILCVGAFTMLAAANPLFAPELRGVLANAIAGDAIPHSARGALAVYWPGPDATRGETAPDPPREESATAPGELWDDWPPTASPSLLESVARKNLPWTLTGRRALITGTERGGVGEIWCHPYRVALRVQLKVDGRDPDVSMVRIAPDEIVRILRLGEVELTERITTALEQGLVFWSIVADGSVEVALSWETDLRRALPYPSSAGSLSIAQQGDYHARVSLAQTSVSAEILVPAGRLTHSDGRFEVLGEGIVKVVLAGGPAVADLTRGLDGLRRRKLRAYRQERILHARRLEERLTVLETPDSLLDRSFRWAKVRLDAAVTEWPGLGRGLLAENICMQPERARALGGATCAGALAALAMGDREIARDALRLLTRTVAASGRIVHELATSGPAYYDDPDATRLLPILADGYAAWTGDLATLERSRTALEGVMRLVAEPPTAGASEWKGRTAWERGEWESALAALLGEPIRPGTAEPRGVGWAVEVIRSVVEGLWGVIPDAPRQAVTIAPYLPPAWDTMILRRLRVGATTLDLRLRRRGCETLLGIERANGPGIRVTARLRSRDPVLQISVRDEPLGGGRASFEVSGEHEVAFVTG